MQFSWWLLWKLKSPKYFNWLLSSIALTCAWILTTPEQHVRLNLLLQCCFWKRRPSWLKHTPNTKPTVPPMTTLRISGLLQNLAKPGVSHHERLLTFDNGLTCSQALWPHGLLVRSSCTLDYWAVMYSGTPTVHELLHMKWAKSKGWFYWIARLQRCRWCTGARRHWQTLWPEESALYCFHQKALFDT